MSRPQGQKCHRGACLNTTSRVAWWNTMTRQLYCQSCAFKINEYAAEPFLFRVPDACGPESGCKGTGRVAPPGGSEEDSSSYCSCWTGMHLRVREQK